MRYLLMAGLLWTLAPAPAPASDALQYTRTVLENASGIAASPRTHEEKLQALSVLFKSFLDTDEMGRIALGTHWTSFTVPQQKEFLILFGRLLEKTYVQELLLFDNPHFTYDGESNLNGQTRVDTTIVTPRDNFAVVYRLRPDGERWLATGIKVENVSLTANLGSQLDNLLSKSSVEDVIALMRRKYGDDAGKQQ